MAKYKFAETRVSPEDPRLNNMNLDQGNALLAVDLAKGNYAKAAEKLGVKLGTLKSRTHRARKILTGTNGG